MRLIDADRLLDKRMQGKYYHLPNGDVAIPIIDIEHAPTVKAERTGKWIPCSERMPKKPCECIATIEVQMWENTYRTVRKIKFANGRFKVADKVLAWMPWPEPYQSKEITHD